MVQKRDLKKVEWGGTAKHKPSNREGRAVKNLSCPQGRWRGECIAGGQLLTNPAVCHPGEHPNAVNAARTHVSVVQCSAKHGFEGNGIQIVARHFFPGEPTGHLRAAASLLILA